MKFFCSQITNWLLTHRLSLIPRYFNTKFLSGPQNQLLASLKIISTSRITRSFLTHHHISTNHNYFITRILWSSTQRGGGYATLLRLDPPRQALCLRMAYRVPYPNLLSLPQFLMISFPNNPNNPNNPGVGPAPPPPCLDPADSADSAGAIDFGASKTPQDASKTPPRGPRRPQACPKTV